MKTITITQKKQVEGHIGDLLQFFFLCDSIEHIERLPAILGWTGWHMSGKQKRKEEAGQEEWELFNSPQ